MAQQGPERQNREHPGREAAGDAADRRTRRPRSLIVSFFGTYGRTLGGWVSVAALIALMEDLGVDAQGVRSAVSRLKRRGLLTAERSGGAAGYRLSAEGLRILGDGDRRIFDPGAGGGGAGGEWVLVVFSVPESERALRHRLRSRLTWLGFGTVAAGVRVAPAHLAGEARRAIAELGAGDRVQLFTGRWEDIAGGGEADAAAHWWDLPALAAMYRAYLAEYAPLLEQWRRSPGSGADAFAAHLQAVDEWRRMPFLDPGLPPHLLPAGWPGTRAAQVFTGLHTLLRAPALAHVRAAASG
ncbi:PaaX family transcriptional regulator [Nocardiopsis coralliicola]